MGALRPKSLAAHRGIDAHFFLNMPLRVDRPDQRVANESGDEEAGKNIKDNVVDIITRNALGKACVMQVIDDHRADDSRRRPCGKQTAMDRADEPRAEHVGEIGRHDTRCLCARIYVLAEVRWRWMLKVL